MSALATNARFLKANPHALSAILEASETKSIISSKDIFDISGTMLWARNQPVSRALQQKLLNRQLREPLESCLLAEDGVTGHTLLTFSEELLQRHAPLTPVLQPYASRLLAEIAHLPMHGVVQLLLTAGQVSKPTSFEHAAQAMLLNGALAMWQGAKTPDVRLAMLAGLIHDLGEMYIAPEFGEADADQDLGFESFKHLVVHPHIGQVLVTQLTDYPAVVARAVAEHHERLDGSGYPHRLNQEDVSPLGRLTAVTEATLHALRHPHAQLGHASVALRVVPGEFDMVLAGLISDTSRQQPALQANTGHAQLLARLARLSQVMQTAEQGAQKMLRDPQLPDLQLAMELALHLIARLRVGWNASGLWTATSMTEQDQAEAEAVEAELEFRLRAIRRAVQWRAAKAPDAQLLKLEQWCNVLETVCGVSAPAQ